MASKQPLYTALGWVTWTLGKRAIKRKLTGGEKSHRVRNLVLGLVVLSGAGAGAYALSSQTTTEA